MSLSTSNCSLRAFDPVVRREIFRFLRDDLTAAANLVMAYPELEGEIGSEMFAEYRASGSFALYDLMTALITVPSLSSFVTTMHLDAFLDGPGQSGVFEWLLNLVEAELQPGHVFYVVIYSAWELDQRCVAMGCTWAADGSLRAWENWHPSTHINFLFAVLAVLCDNDVVVNMPLA